MLQSCLCTESQLRSPDFQAWAVQMKESPSHMHRKLWEYCYIAQVLAERGMLQPGKRGLGFAVGHEPLPALFASMGSEIVATDLGSEHDVAKVWSSTGQHAAELNELNTRGICDPETFARWVSFRSVDMNAIPSDLNGFNFIWSSCSLEHLGGLDKGRAFIINSLRCLKPGGIAVHTTEFNVSSNTDTVTQGYAVIYRQRDIREIAQSLKLLGHSVADLNFDVGNDSLDKIIDQPPYGQPYGDEPVAHLKLNLMGYVATSIGLIIQKRETEDVIPVTDTSKDKFPNDILRIGAPDIDVEQIMTQIRDNIKKRRIEAEARGLDFDALAQGRYRQYVGERFSGEVYEALYDAQMAVDKNMTSLMVTTRPLPVISSLIRRIRESMHNLVIFYVNRAAQRQAGFNSLITKSVAQLLNAMEREGELDTKERRIAQLEQRLAQLEQQLAARRPE